jgi:cell division protein FtsL
MENKLFRKRKEIEKTIFIVFILIFLYTFTFPVIKYIKLKLEINKIEYEIVNYKDKIEDLKKKIDFYKSDDGVERWIKENFKFIREGERIYIFKEKNVD